MSKHLIGKRGSERLSNAIGPQLSAPTGQPVFGCIGFMIAAIFALVLPGPANGRRRNDLHRFHVARRDWFLYWFSADAARNDFSGQRWLEVCQT